MSVSCCILLLKMMEHNRVLAGLPTHMFEGTDGPCTGSRDRSGKPFMGAFIGLRSLLLPFEGRNLIAEVPPRHGKRDA